MCKSVLDTDSYKSPLVRKVGMPKPNKELSTSLPKQITAKILLTSNQGSKRSSHHHWLKYSGRSIIFVLSLWPFQTALGNKHIFKSSYNFFPLKYISKCVRLEELRALKSEAFKTRWITLPCWIESKLILAA